MTKPVKNIAASVRQRLENVARAQRRPFQELLEYYAMERFLYRLARSPHAGRFVLKGALLFRAWSATVSRPTRDIDLLGRMENTVEAVISVFHDVCSLAVEPDGLIFDPATIAGVAIKEDADYAGVRVTFRATLQNARVAMQADVGFGDVISPGTVVTDYPTILEFPAPRLTTYPKETVVAEKFEAMTKLGLLNSRLKDFYDLWALSRQFDFGGRALAAAIEGTFSNRKTPVVPLPVALTPAFATDRGKEAQWKGFLRKAKITDVPEDLGEVIGAIGAFLCPVAEAVARSESFDRAWLAPGPWE